MGRHKLFRTMGIDVLRQLEKVEVDKISYDLSKKIANTFNWLDFNYLYEKLSDASMYLANIPNGLNRVMYLYENSSIYIDTNENINECTNELLHECIHKIQEIKDKKGQVKKVGQCIFGEFRVYGMALNEAAVQYIVSKIKKEEEQKITAYGITALTYSPQTYPLISNLVAQLMCIIGEKGLIDSTLYSDENFAIECIEALGEGTFYSIQSNLDTMLYDSEKIIELKNTIKQNSNKGVNLRTQELEQRIKNVYLEVQTLIYTTYFDKLFRRLENMQDISSYESKLQEYQKWLGVSDQDVYNDYFENYYKQKLELLEEKRIEITRKNNMSLTVVHNNKIFNIIRKIKELISKKISGKYSV